MFRVVIFHPYPQKIINVLPRENTWWEFSQVRVATKHCIKFGKNLSLASDKYTQSFNTTSDKSGYVWKDLFSQIWVTNDETKWGSHPIYSNLAFSGYGLIKQYYGLITKN